MSDFVSRDEIRRSRVADLYAYMLAFHASEVIRVGQNLKFIRHDSLMIHKGYPGYVRNSSGETGNPIDFLVKYMGYSFTEAVRLLSSFENSGASDYGPAQELPLKAPNSPVEASALAGALLPGREEKAFPRACKGPFRRAFAYLSTTRGLSPAVVNALFEKGLAYQDEYGNAVFLNHERSYCEVRGTLSYAKFHRNYKAAGIRPYWHFHVGKGQAVAYVCESAIDAISLYEIRKWNGTLENGSSFCSIGGAGKQNAIERILEAGYGKVIIAVDKDTAGDGCRARNANLRSLIPRNKDWNEDLIALKKGRLDLST